jgi:hypothetical protein
MKNIKSKRKTQQELYNSSLVSLGFDNITESTSFLGVSSTDEDVKNEASSQLFKVVEATDISRDDFRGSFSTEITIALRKWCSADIFCDGLNLFGSGDDLNVDVKFNFSAVSFLEIRAKVETHPFYPSQSPAAAKWMDKSSENESLAMPVFRNRMTFVERCPDGSVYLNLLYLGRSTRSAWYYMGRILTGQFAGVYEAYFARCLVYTK